MLLVRIYIYCTDFPLIHSVANELEAIADPQPKVLNLASMILPLSSTLICEYNAVMTF